jgi:hypothetical protein
LSRISNDDKGRGTGRRPIDLTRLRCLHRAALAETGISFKSGSCRSAVRRRPLRGEKNHRM